MLPCSPVGTDGAGRREREGPGPENVGRACGEGSCGRGGAFLCPDQTLPLSILLGLRDWFL